MAFSGYRLYRGVGGIANVDFSTVVATAEAGASAVNVAGAGHLPDTRYTYVLRPVLQDLETPDVSCAVEFRTGAGGAWPGAAPAGVEAPDATVGDGGRISLTWTYRTPYTAAPPADFCVYHAPSRRITYASPQATLPYTRDGRYEMTLALTGGATYFFAVTARSAQGTESDPCDCIGPCVPDDDAPQTPTVYTNKTFQ